ncbi:adenine-specific DNA-methyltransferase [Prevotella jejuni]|uniref:site-specific DNA-methyltransferase (adenine-specific) n=2 Tax=Prevotella jejuni TaxID=1177574 RepID=A0AA94LLN5_9BACT|nr:adenine-specific DNA-methyltransferase [Prevotella jejuni]
MTSATHSEFTLEALRQIAPSAFTEVRGADGELTQKVDFKVLRELLGDAIADADEESFGFQWVGKQEAKRAAAEPTRQTLRPVVDDSVDWDTTENLYIEGDNLEVLKLLQRAYLGKVKMIYIDPPYNTGNDFVYEDDFAMSGEEMDEAMGNVDEKGNRLRRNLDSNPRYHSDWCSMIYSRLLVARTLLANDGVIFISIDDNEVHHLRKICDEVFGVGNFVTEIAWRRTDNQPNIGKIARVKEYILIYAKNSADYSLGRLSLSEKARAEYRYSDAKGSFRRGILLDKTRGRKFYPKQTKLGNILNGPWMVSEEIFDKLDANDEIYWTESGDGQPYKKIYLKENKGQIPSDFWGIEFGTNQRGSLEVEDLFKQRIFDFPKPVSLLCNLINVGVSNFGDDSLILDFFSGSATTAHAVMQLNAEDGGKRKYICVQLPEETPEGSEARKAGYNTICEIGKERIRRAGKKIKEEAGLMGQDLDTGFRVFRTDLSNMKEVYFKPAKLQQQDLFAQVDSVKADRSELDLLFGCMVDWGVELSYPLRTEEVNGKHLHIVNEGALVACFDKEISVEAVSRIAELKPLRVIFREECFATDADKLNIYEKFKQFCGWNDEEVYKRIHVL